jgi:hypothetical protein
LYCVSCLLCLHLTECFVELPCTNATIQEVVRTMQTIRRILSESFSSARWQDMVVAIGLFDSLADDAFSLPSWYCRAKSRCRLRIHKRSVSATLSDDPCVRSNINAALCRSVVIESEPRSKVGSLIRISTQELQTSTRMKEKKQKSV